MEINMDFLIKLIESYKEIQSAFFEIYNLFNGEYEKLGNAAEMLRESILDYVGFRKDNMPIGFNTILTKEDWESNDYFCRDFINDMFLDYTEGTLSLDNLIKELLADYNK